VNHTEAFGRVRVSKIDVQAALSRRGRGRTHQPQPQRGKGTAQRRPALAEEPLDRQSGMESPPESPPLLLFPGKESDTSEVSATVPSSSSSISLSSAEGQIAARLQMSLSLKRAEEQACTDSVSSVGSSPALQSPTHPGSTSRLDATALKLELARADLAILHAERNPRLAAESAPTTARGEGDQTGRSLVPGFSALSPSPMTPHVGSKAPANTPSSLDRPTLQNKLHDLAAMVEEEDCSP